jgi:hypothetical protein
MKLALQLNNYIWDGGSETVRYTYLAKMPAE